MTLWVWLGGGLMALGTIVAIGPTVRRKLLRPRRHPDACDADRAGARGRATARRRGGGVKHPFRWIALAVGAGVCVLAVVLALTVSSDPHRGREHQPAGGQAGPGVHGEGLDGTPIKSSEPRGQDRARELLELVVHPVPRRSTTRSRPGTRSTRTTRASCCVGIVREDTTEGDPQLREGREGHVAGRVRSGRQGGTGLRHPRPARDLRDRSRRRRRRVQVRSRDAQGLDQMVAYAQGTS